jgi:hypothetical protein
MTAPTLPTKSLLQGAEYTHSSRTDIRARFAAMRAAEEAEKAEPVKPANVQRLSERRRSK